MLPELFRIGSFALPTYGVLLAAGFLAALLLFRKRADVAGASPDTLSDLGIWILLGGLAGAKVLLVIVEWPQHVRSMHGFLDLLRSAGVFYGGLIGAILVAALLMKRRGLSFWRVVDAGAPAVALGQGIGRLGCLAAGCCWGSVSHHPWAITFTNPLAGQNVGVPLGVPLHPTQLYESIGTLVLCVLLVVFEKRRFAGETFARYLVGYAVLRFTVEIFRGDPRGAVSVLSTSQLIAIAGLLFGLGIFVLRGRRPAEPAPSPA